VDSVVSKQAKKEQRDSSLGWVDYKKAFDSVHYSWLLRVLELYKIDPKVIQLLITLMTSWRTTLHVRTESSSYKIDELPIRRGIFQGYSRGPLWFCLALNPLSRMLRTSGYGYIVMRRPNVSISHQFYMDDLKLYARSPDQLQNMFALVKSFSDSICMEFGLDKCAVFHAKNGKVQDPENVLEIMGDTVIQDLTDEDNYKYLGLHQILGIADTTARKQVEKKVRSRIEKVCKS
jgi:hypothetical protein